MNTAFARDVGAPERKSPAEQIPGCYGEIQHSRPHRVETLLCYECNLTVSAGGIKSLRAGASGGIIAPLPVEEPPESCLVEASNINRHTHINES